MQKLLTFAVPTYNMEEYLEKCIRSCVCDNMEFLDIIIVNDGSKDKSSEIGHKLADEYPDIVRIIDKENGHYGSCVNRALIEATGKYFKMLDPDDWVETDALNSLLEQMKTMDSDLIVTVSEDRRIKDMSLLSRMSIPNSVDNGKIYNARTFDGLSMKATHLYCSHNLTYKTEILKKIKLKLKVGINYTDNEFVFYPLDQIQSIVFFDLPVYQYLVGRPGASTTNADIKMQTQMWIVLHDIFEYFYANYEITPEPVRNNQRILIAEMVKWIYNPIFYNFNKGRFIRDKDRENFLFIIQPYVSKDIVIQKLLSFYYKHRRIDWYNHYLQTGKVLEFNPFLDINMSYSYFKCLCIQMLKGILRIS